MTRDNQEPRFTPAPWVQFIDRDAGTITVMPAGRSGEIAEILLHYNGDANAHLIASAPELYAALSDLLTADGRWHDYIDMALVERAAAALAKARGDTGREA